MLIVIDTEKPGIFQLWRMAPFASMVVGDRYLPDHVLLVDTISTPNSISAEKRHIATPLPPSNKHAMAYRVGMDIVEKLKLEPLGERVLGVVRKCDRPPDASYIRLDDAGRRSINACRISEELCIAISPEPPAEKTAMDWLVEVYEDVSGAETANADMWHGVQEFIKTQLGA